MKVIEMGIHSVGTKPTGSTIPCLTAARRELVVSIDRNGVAGHVGHVEAAAVGIDGQRHRLGAEVALAGQAGVEVALDGEFVPRQR